MLNHPGFRFLPLAMVISSATLAAEPVAPDCSRDTATIQRQSSAVFGKGVFLVAWSDGARSIDNPTADIYCARVDAATGKSLDPAGIRICAAPDLQEWPAVAFDGANFLVVWQDLRNGNDYDLYAARVSPEGKVLDPDGFAVANGKSNQARPAVVFADKNFVVAWMDSREYPVYGLYGARITPGGEVTNPLGLALDAEAPETIAKARPVKDSWLGDKNNWWQSLQSRYCPALGFDGKTCLVAMLRDEHANNTRLHVMGISPQDLSVTHPPRRLSGTPRDRPAVCATPQGWVVAFDQWMPGWGLAARMAAHRLDANLEPLDEIPPREDPGKARLPATPMIDLQMTLAGLKEDQGGEYQQGKGHSAFWQSAVAWDGANAVVAMDYGWRPAPRERPGELAFAIAVSQLNCAHGRFADQSPRAIAESKPADGNWVGNPVLAASPDGTILAVYEHDTGIGRHFIEGLILPKP